MTEVQTESGLRPCGTYGGWQRHRVNGQKPCEPCRLARNAYMTEYRKRQPETIKAQMRQARLRTQAASILIKLHHREYLDILTALKTTERP